jgi:hypothetical protein
MFTKSMTAFLCFFILISASLAGVKEVGNGGDAVAMEFRSIGQTIVKQLKLSKMEDYKGLNISKLDLIINLVLIETTNKELRIGKNRKDAINFPASRRILINAKNWNKLSLENKRQLIIHESMGLLKVLDENNEVSIGLEKIANTKISTCTFLKLVDNEITDRKKTVVESNDTQMSFEHDSTVAILKQVNNQAFLTIKNFNFEENAVTSVGGEQIALSHLQDGIEFKLECSF